MSAKKDKNYVKTAKGRKVIKIFNDNLAYNDKEALPVSSFIDLPYESEIIAKIISDYYDAGLINKTTDNRYFLDIKTYNKEKNKKYWYFVLVLIFLGGILIGYLWINKI